MVLACAYRGGNSCLQGRVHVVSSREYSALWVDLNPIRSMVTFKGGWDRLYYTEHTFKEMLILAIK